MTCSRYLKISCVTIYYICWNYIFLFSIWKGSWLLRLKCRYLKLNTLDQNLNIHGGFSFINSRILFWIFINITIVIKILSVTFQYKIKYWHYFSLEIVFNRPSSTCRLSVIKLKRVNIYVTLVFFYPLSYLFTFSLSVCILSPHKFVKISN